MDDILNLDTVEATILQERGISQRPPPKMAEKAGRHR